MLRYFYFSLLMLFSVSLLAETTIMLSAPLGDSDLNKAIDKVIEEAKLGYADINITYSTSMGRQTIWVEVKFITNNRSQNFIDFYRENNMNIYMLKDGDRFK